MEPWNLAGDHMAHPHSFRSSSNGENFSRNPIKKGLTPHPKSSAFY
jgi:hypothetical protein